MPKYIISYDINAAHKKFLTECEVGGLLYVIDGYTQDNTMYLYRLPNTTVWGEFSNKDAAQSAFNAAHQRTNSASLQTVVVEKRMISDFNEYSVGSDRCKRPEAKWTGISPFQTCRLHQRNDPFFS
jgi:hypothetical protein